MNKKILLSMLTIGVTLTMVVGATTALFSDTETSTGNTFSAGTIDIAVDTQNPWSRTTPYNLEDMKPSYTDYIDFTIKNVGNNPANVWKKLENVVTSDNVQSEPECTAEGGTWSGTACSGQSTPKNDIDGVIGYDLSMELYDASDVKQMWTRLYNNDVLISAIKNTNMYLGMIPEGWSMKVHQSYHMSDAAGNEYQGDKMIFDIKLYAEQLLGGTRGASMVLEDKNGDPDWDINEGNDIKGTLSYTVSAPKFEYAFSGKAPLASTNYSLVVYHEPFSTPSGSGWPRTVTILGSAASDAGKNISIAATSVELNTNLTNAKIWLVRTADIAAGKLNVWSSASYLFETGMIEYRDTDL